MSKIKGHISFQWPQRQPSCALPLRGEIAMEVLFMETKEEGSKPYTPTSQHLNYTNIETRLNNRFTY